MARKGLGNGLDTMLGVNTTKTRKTNKEEKVETKEVVKEVIKEVVKEVPTEMTSNQFRAFAQAENSTCLLEKFPEQIRTTKMQQLFFAAPAGAINPNTFKVFNSRTGASAGKIYKYESPVQIEDAGVVRDEHGNIRKHDYDVFYISNAKADSGTNTYTIEYEIGGTN